MSGVSPNPVLAPIRRWVLYSRTHLAITVVGVVALLFATGAVFGQDPPPRSTAHEVDVSAEPALTETISYDLEEVSESLVAAKTAAWIAKSAPATAMAYAHTFVDGEPSDGAWTSAIGSYTTGTPGEDLLAARPTTPVVITGPTVSTPIDGPGGTRAARVAVPTQAGDLQVSLTVEEASAGARWVVDTPLPTLDLSEVEKVAPASPPVPARATPVPATPRADMAASQPTFDLDTPMPATSPGSLAPAPVPVPGPIPIPDLDTPIPGSR